MPGGIQSLYASLSGTLEGMMPNISLPTAGQSNQPALQDQYGQAQRVHENKILHNRVNGMVPRYKYRTSTAEEVRIC